MKDELVILHALLAHRRELNYSDLLKDREGKKKNLEDFNKLNFPSSQVRATTVIPEKKKFYERDGKYTDNIAKTSMDNQGLIKELDESIQTISRRVKERLQNSSV